MIALLAKNIMALVSAVIMLVSPSLMFNQGTGNQTKVYDNVILMIGDGMGENTIKAAKALSGIDYELNMEKMPVKSWNKTNNIYDETTDSAAGGSALANGYHTYNAAVGVFLWDPLGMVINPRNLCEYAHSVGKSSGVVTTAIITDATPAVFTAHSAARKMDEDIIPQQLKSDVDLIWGGTNPFATKEYTEKCGRTYVSNLDELEALDGSTKSYGQFNPDDLKYIQNPEITPTIDVMTQKALEILDKDEDGFFLMIEGACIDKFSHSNDFEGMRKSLLEFDKAIGTAVDFAEKDGNTLVLVTADHETGGITYNAETGSYYYTTGSHTSVDVPVFVSDTEAGFVNGEAYLNRQIGVQLGYALGATEKTFPAVNCGRLSLTKIGKSFGSFKYYIDMIRTNYELYG